MDDVSPFIDHLAREIEFTYDERELLASCLIVKRLKRRQFLDQPGFISKYRSYVVQGAFRAYIIDKDGQEHIMSLAIEDGWIGDPGSFFSQQPGSFFVEAFEDATIIQLSYDHEQLLLEKIPKLHSYFRLRAQRAAVNIQKRLIANFVQSAEERYDIFASEHPDLLLRFPLYVIASYLNMSRVFLSKIRNNRINNQDSVK